MDDGLTMHWLRLEDVLTKTVSYAQNHEDILLGRVFPGPEGFYLDVGANHPTFHSVTKLFYDRGWSGINVEPSPLVFDRLVADRPRDRNLNVGLSDRDATLTFYETNVYHGWSTFREELAAHYRGIGVPMAERPVPSSRWPRSASGTSATGRSTSSRSTPRGSSARSCAAATSGGGGPGSW